MHCRNCSMLHLMRLLWVAQKYLSGSSKFWKEINFLYQEGLLLLPKTNNWAYCEHGIKCQTWGGFTLGSKTNETKWPRSHKKLTQGIHTGFKVQVWKFGNGGNYRVVHKALGSNPSELTRMWVWECIHRITQVLPILTLTYSKEC